MTNMNGNNLNKKYENYDFKDKTNEELKQDVSQQCINCGKCKEACSFLTKYDMTFKDMEKIEEHAYSCFLCGRCTEVCPVGIDGRQVFMSLRKNLVKTDSPIFNRKKYKGMLFEKENYKFKNYRNTQRSVLFPGCNYLSLYPKTTKVIAEYFKHNFNIGIVYDCCGKPVAELGLEKEENIILNNLEKNLKKKGITEIVTMCPNCYYYLRNRISIPIVSIYEKLNEIGYNYKRTNEKFNFYLPCPDRVERHFLKGIESFVGESNTIDDIQCCGLGGAAINDEPEISLDMGKSVENHEEKVYTYCATCTGKFNRDSDVVTYHILSEIFKTYEVADIKKSYLNRAIKKIKS